jgi:hypothetical protein
VPPIFGCTDPTADNHDLTATIDDGSCTYPIYGCTDPNADNYDSTATVDDGSCTYPVYTLPPFTFTHTVTQDFIDLAWNGTSGGTIVTMFTFSLNVQPAINILPNSSGVTYAITELYYIDNTGTQIDIERTTNSNLLTPPYGLLPIPPFGLMYYFDPATGSNISTYTTPANITPGVLLGAPNNISGVILPNNLGQGFTVDVYCTVEATDSGAITTSHTEMITITV